MKSGILAGMTAALLLSSAAARADVEISNKPTSNMSCVSGVCTATAQKAVLNVSDLATMLASGDVAVKTGSVAKDIDIDQPLQWTSTSRLTLDAQQSVVVNKQVTVAGQGAVTINTYHSGPRSELYFLGKGSITFWDTSSSLIIDGQSYTFVTDIETMAAAIAGNRDGAYALANDFDAKDDGTYSAPPVNDLGQKGTLEGLGHAISRFRQRSAGKGGLLVDNHGVLRDLHVNNAKIFATGSAVGVLAPLNHGYIFGCGVSGSIGGGVTERQDAGGLVGDNEGDIYYSHAAVDVSTGEYAGGLVGYHNNTLDGIVESYATGSVNGYSGGGLVGYAIGTVQDSYASGAVTADFGGGFEAKGGELVKTSYSTGAVTGTGTTGGFFGSAGGAENDYWDTETSGMDQGCGNGECTGVTGLTTEQFQAGLPEGFDRKIWGHSPKINNGFPYLLRNPPEK